MTPYARLALALCASAGGLGWAAHACAEAEAAAGSSVAGVVVTAPRQETEARDKQREAPNILSIQSAETIQKYPDFNAAESLGRMPGVSISTDTGEGRFVNIRGIDGNLVGATFGGVPLLNTNAGGTYFGGGGRAVEFDTIPTGSIDGLIVTKTTLPDHEAEGLGGTIEITPRSAADITRPFFDGALEWGYERSHDHTGPFNIEAAVGARFGFGPGGLVVEGRGPARADTAGWISNPTPFSFVLTASRRDDRRGFDDIEEDYNDPTADHAYADIQMRRYDYHRRRFGYGGEFDFQPNDDHRYFFRANVAGYKEAVKKNRLTYDDLGDTPNPANPKGFSTSTDVTLSSTDEEETHRNQVYVVGGRDAFGEAVVDYRASYSRATFAVGKNYGTKFTGPQGLAFVYDNSGDDGDFPQIGVNSAVVNDPAQYNAIKKISNSTEQDRDQEFAYAANLQLPLHLFGQDDSLKAGAEVRLRDKQVNPSAFTYAIAPLSLASVSDPAVTDFYGRYTNGPDVNTIAVRNAAAAGVVSGGLDESAVLRAKEDIYAAYGQYQATHGPWTLLAGVRVEKTHARYGAFSDDNPTQDLLFVAHTKDYTNAFPTVQLRYEVSPQFLIRATYSTGIARPGFLQNSATTSSNHDPTDPQITQGNPDLRPTTGDNFDLSFEYYLPNGGIVQVGLFDKEFDDYIVKQTQKLRYTGTDPEFAGLIVSYNTFGNRPGAYARGLEAAYHQQFDWLPGLFAGLGADANVTLVDSHIEEYDAATSSTGHAESGLLPGTSRLTWNLAGFYEAHGLKLRLAAEYVSKELFSLGGSKASDTIQDNRLTLDFTTSYQVTHDLQVYFAAKNLTNEPLRFYVTDRSFPIQREFYKQTFEAGVRAHF